MSPPFLCADDGNDSFSTSVLNSGIQWAIIKVIMDNLHPEKKEELQSKHKSERKELQGLFVHLLNFVDLYLHVHSAQISIRSLFCPNFRVGTWNMKSRSLVYIYVCLVFVS